jgi:hypothetical protein
LTEVEAAPIGDSAVAALSASLVDEQLLRPVCDAEDMRLANAMKAVINKFY